MSATTTGNLAKLVQQIRTWAVAGDLGRLPDQDLVRRYVTSNDEAAFSFLVKRHGPMVLGICRKILRHEQDSEDAFQATFLVLAKKARAIRKQEAVGSWLYSVAYRIANKLRVAQARRKARENPLHDDAPARGADDLTWREVQLGVCAELDRMADKYRAPLLLCYIQGKTRDEAAQQLGWDLGVFRGRLDRGRELLRARLRRRGLSLSAALLALGITDKASAALSVPAALFPSTIEAALCTAKSTAACGVVSAQVAALTQGVIQAMFLCKLKSVVVGLVTLALVSTGVGVVSYRTSAQDTSPVARAQKTSEPGKQANNQVDPRKLQQEIERLRRELAQTREELLAALRENAALRARAEADKVKPKTQTEADKAAADLREAALKAILESSNDQAKKLREAAIKALLETRKEQQKKNLDRNKGKTADPRKTPTAASPDKSRLAVAHDKVIHILDTQTGKELARGMGHTEAVSALAFSPDGKVLVSGSKDKSVVMWDTASLRQIRKFSVPNAVSGIRFSSDGRSLTVIESNRTQHEFDIATGKELSVTKDKGNEAN